MSIAPPNSASMADGPALKLVHCTLTCGPIALSNHPFALATIACAWVMLGNAPTRMTVCAHVEIAAVNAKTIPMTSCLDTLLSPHDHGQDAGFFLLLGRTLALRGARARISDEVSQGSIFQNVGGCVANVEK